METYKITLSDGTVLENLRLNGDNYISNQFINPSVFENNLSLVTISGDEGSKTYSNMELVHLTQYGDEYWFTLREVPESEVKQKILEALAESLLASKPTAEKKGFSLVPVFQSESGTVAWEYVSNGEAEGNGSYLNPIQWEAGMKIYAGVNPDYESDGWYIFDGLIQRCIKDGTPDSFTDAEYWEIMT